MKNLLASIGVIGSVILALLLIWGYIANIVKLLSANGFELMEAIRCLGLIIPFLGSILGFVG